MHERHEQEGQLRPLQRLIRPGPDRFLRQRQRQGVSGETASVFPVQIAGKLVEYDDFSQPSFGRFTPVPELGPDRPVVGLAKAGSDGLVDFSESLEPLLRRQFIEPECQHIFDRCHEASLSFQFLPLAGAATLSRSAADPGSA